MTCRPIGSLPPRRDAIVEAAATPAVQPMGSGWGNSINIPKARDRMLEYFEREQVPGDVHATLAYALNGNLHYQHMLFNAMLDTWPKLQKAIDEVARMVSVAPWKVHPFALRGDKPTTEAENQAKEIEQLIWRMRPDAKRGEDGIEGMIKALVRGRFYGHQVLEIRWMRDDGGVWVPRCTKTVPPRFYGYPDDTSTGADLEDRLMFIPDGDMGYGHMEDFPDHRFMIAINKGHEGHAATAAPLRALAAYWLSAVYGLKWFMDFTQRFGIPFRHAEIASENDRPAVEGALEEMGANAYLVTMKGTKINVIDSPQIGSNIPQKVLLDLADQKCDQFILGQTLTGGTDDSGSRALGEVHEKTRNAVVDGVADFVGGVLTYQFIPAIIAHNWGDSLKQAPEMWAKREEVKDEKALAERDEKIGIFSGKLPVAKSWVYERHGVPIPADGDELLVDEEEMAAREEAAQEANAPGKQAPKKKEEDDVSAADAGDWETFADSLDIPRAEMPQIKSGDRSAMVQFLRARGIEVRPETVKASSLRPTQREYSPGKVEMARTYKGGNRSILISQDGHVIDGHHQWKASLDAGGDIGVLRIMAPVQRVLMIVHRMPSTTVAAQEAESFETEVDRLSANVMEDLSGVKKEWLAPVRPIFERLAALAMSKNVTDEDLDKAVKKVMRELPDVFGTLNTDALRGAFEAAIGTAAVSGILSRQ